MALRLSTILALCLIFPVLPVANSISAQPLNFTEKLLLRKKSFCRALSFNGQGGQFLSLIILMD